MTENINLTYGLISRIDELGGTEIIDKTRVQGITFGKDDGTLDLSAWPVVEVTGGRKLTARLLVGADGANSPVRHFAEIDSRGWDYGRHGVVATLKTAEGEDVGGQKTAFQRFLPTGPVAFLPVGPRSRESIHIRVSLLIYGDRCQETLQLWSGQPLHSMRPV